MVSLPALVGGARGDERKGVYVCVCVAAPDERASVCGEAVGCVLLCTSLVEY